MSTQRKIPPLGAQRKRGDAIALQRKARAVVRTLPYQGTDPQNEFNGLSIVLRTFVVIRRLSSGSNSFAGKSQSRKSTAVLPQVCSSFYEAAW